MTGTVTILGINGRIGQEVGKAFAAAGWRVTGMGRTDRAGLAGVRFVAGDAANVDDISRAVAGADVVVNALNLPYDKWDKGRYEAQLATVLAALKGSGRTLMFPGNIYNYAASDHVLTPETPQRPARDKGEIRVRQEQMLEAAAQASDVQVLIVRTGDFYAPDASGSMFDLALLSRLKSNLIQYPADLGIAHSWAYLPDVGRAYVRIAERRAGFGRFESFHYAGHVATGRQLVAAVQKALPRPARVTRLPWGLMKIVGIAVPVVREVVKMSYLWVEPHRLVDPRLDAILGEGFGTDFEEAVARTTRSYLPQAKSDAGPKRRAA